MFLLDVVSEWEDITNTTPAQIDPTAVIAAVAAVALVIILLITLKKK